MKTITKTFNVYSYDELNPKIQSKVINESIQFFLDMDWDFLSPNMQKALTKADKMQTPWFSGEYMWDYAKDDIMESVKGFDYLEDGEIFIED